MLGTAKLVTIQRVELGAQAPEQEYPEGTEHLGNVPRAQGARGEQVLHPEDTGEHREKSDWVSKGV